MARRILVFANNDFTLRKAGSHVRISEMMDFLDTHFDGVIVYGFYEHPEDPWDEAAQQRFAAQYPRMSLVLDHRTGRFGKFTKIKTGLLNLFPSRAASVLGLSDTGSTPNWQKIRKHPDDYVLIVHWVDGAAWLNGLPDCPFWIESHDVKFLKHAKKTGLPVHSASVSRRLLSEAAVLARAAGIISISPVDQAILSGLSPKNPNFYLPSYLADFDVVEAPARPDYKYDVVFVGSGNAFNVDGLCGFVERNAQWLAGKRFAVAGAVSKGRKASAALAKVPSADVLGFVDDLSVLYAQSKTVISPVDGTGLKIKVIDALCHGKPVFASEHSQDALPPGFQDCVFDLDPTAIDAMLADDAALEQAMQGARDYCATLGKVGDREKLLTSLKAQVAS